MVKKALTIAEVAKRAGVSQREIRELARKPATCSTCRRWNRDMGGMCSAPYDGPPEGPKVELEVGNPYEGASMETSADFGCVLHEAEE